MQAIRVKFIYFIDTGFVVFSGSQQVWFCQSNVMIAQHNWCIEIYTLFDGDSGLQTSNLFIPESYATLESANEVADKVCREIRGSGFNIYQSDIAS